MKTPQITLADLGEYFPDDFTPEERAKALFPALPGSFRERVQSDPIGWYTAR